MGGFAAPNPATTTMCLPCRCRNDHSRVAEPRGLAWWLSAAALNQPQLRTSFNKCRRVFLRLFFVPGARASDKVAVERQCPHLNLVGAPLPRHGVRQRRRQKIRALPSGHYRIFLSVVLQTIQTCAGESAAARKSVAFLSRIK